MLDKTLAVIKKKKLCDTMGNVKAQALVNMLDDALGEVDAMRRFDTQLVKTLAKKLKGMDTKTLVTH